MDLGDAQVLMDFVNNDEVQRGGSGGLLGDCLDDLNEGGYATGPVMGATGGIGNAKL